MSNAKKEGQVKKDIKVKKERPRIKVVRNSTKADDFTQYKSGIFHCKNPSVKRASSTKAEVKIKK